MRSLLPRLLLTLSLLLGLELHAQERILEFAGDISVQSDGSMLVEERITVQAEGERIRRGIYRDFPTDYRDSHGNRYRVGFDLLQVLRDGQSEPYHTESLDNGVRIYAGDKDVFLQQGIYTYTLRYRTDRQLGFFDQHDELYWNLTGNGWEFAIDKASARVRLPGGVPADVIRVEGYTGPQGAKGQNYRAWVEYDGSAMFETTTPLRPREGLTIVASWPKGHVQEPGDGERLGWFLQDNSETAIGLAGILVLLIYYIYSWNRVGRDPEPGVIIPEYTPPEEFSPASLRFIKRMGYDNKAFSAAIVNMAVAGYLQISQDADDKFTLTRTGQTTRLAPGENALAKALFAGGDRITLIQSNHSRLRSALKAHEKALKRNYETTHFKTNRQYLVPGFLISIGTLLLALFSLDSVEQRSLTGFMTIWLSIWTIAVFALLRGVGSAWSSYRQSGSGLGSALGATLFALPFVFGELMGLGVMLFQGSLAFTLCFAVLLITNILFYEWMKAPTQLGQKLLQRADGFGLYLSVAEQEELDFRHPPNKTPELFERYLPYAIALGVEQQWAAKFTRILAQAQASGEAYQPAWYHGSHWDHGNLGSFASTMGGAMSSAISSSSTAPGSSSGSGGGGSSGGGGGGGGGGGW